MPCDGARALSASVDRRKVDPTHPVPLEARGNILASRRPRASGGFIGYWRRRPPLTGEVLLVACGLYRQNQSARTRLAICGRSSWISQSRHGRVRSIDLTKAGIAHIARTGIQVNEQVSLRICRTAISSNFRAQRSLPLRSMARFRHFCGQFAIGLWYVLQMVFGVHLTRACRRFSGVDLLGARCCGRIHRPHLRRNKAQ